MSKGPIEWCGFVVIVAGIEGCAEFQTEGGHRNVAFFGEAMERGDASRWSGPDQVKERAERITFCPSSAMSSDRLFLDRGARRHCPSPLHRQAQTNMRFSHAPAKEDISTLP